MIATERKQQAFGLEIACAKQQDNVAEIPSNFHAAYVAIQAKDAWTRRS
jgi:hypothetical protein